MRCVPPSTSHQPCPAARPAGARARRRGSAIQWIGMASPVAAAIASLVVDWGRLQLVRSELQYVAEAAARHATNSLCGIPSVARNAAIEVAMQNKADGHPVELTAADVELGTWDAANGTFRAFTGAGEVTADAVRVTARRAASRGTAVPMIFGQLTGRATGDVQASAITTLGIEGYGVIGLDFLKLSGNATASWRPDDGSKPVGPWGNVASNGDITLGGSSFVNGHARPGVGRYVYGAEGRVSGTVRQLKTPLVFPNGEAGQVAAFNDDALVPAKYRSGASLVLDSNDKLALPGGNYYFQDVKVMGTLTFTGPATVYCYGDFALHGHARTYSNMPKNLAVVMCPAADGTPPGTLKVWSGTELYASLYAPQSPIVLGGNGDIYGSVLGKSVDMTGTSAIYYDVTLKAHGIGVSLVR